METALERTLMESMLRIGQGQNEPGNEEFRYVPSDVQMLETLVDFIKEKNRQYLLVDIGAGTGAFIYLAGLLTGLRALGIEKSPVNTGRGMIKMCDIIEMDVLMEKLPLRITQDRNNKLYYLFNPVSYKEMMIEMLNTIKVQMNPGDVIVFYSVMGDIKLEGVKNYIFEPFQIYENVISTQSEHERIVVEPLHTNVRA